MGGRMSRRESWSILHNDWCISKKTFAIASFVLLDSMHSRATIVSVPSYRNGIKAKIRGRIIASIFPSTHMFEGL